MNHDTPLAAEWTITVALISSVGQGNSGSVVGTLASYPTGPVINQPSSGILKCAAGHGAICHDPLQSLTLRKGSVGKIGRCCARETGRLSGTEPAVA
ncbi:hypothetical protein DPEC_G00211460 [Dallia pectoralis]|uniref:Uncharacterized protein n=1 Tax=Dallia pectoralis TaxID=75939 RepID=A0ACC2G638_DALPE|nr:hypothetical protein DPEC_G00211460 [Dallia pectoralis]